MTRTDFRADFDPLTSALQPFIDRGELAGLAALAWKSGEVAHLDTLGWRDVERQAPMTRDTLFRVASMTKPITSCLIMLLVEDGKIGLNDPITRWAPEFADMRVLRDPGGPVEDTVPASRDITFEDLLTHRAGLAYNFSCSGPIAESYRKTLQPPEMLPPISFARTPDEWMAALGSLPLLHQPGQRYLYSHATDVLGFIAGRIAGKPFRDVLIERVLGPLGMTDTDFWAPPEKRDRLATLYSYSSADDRLAPMPADDSDRPPVFAGGGGGLISTLDDYLTFARMMLGGGEVDGVRLLKAETVRDMLTDRMSARQREDTFLGLPLWAGQGFGLGVSLVDEPQRNVLGVGSKGAFGWPGAYGTWWQADPAQAQILLYMTQHSVELSPASGALLAGGRDMAGRMALPMFQKLGYSALTGVEAADARASSETVR